LSWLIVSCFEHGVGAPDTGAQISPATVEALQRWKLAIFPISGVWFSKNKLPAGLSFYQKRAVCSLPGRIPAAVKVTDSQSNAFFWSIRRI
jgi:hypothetical protein